MIFAISRRKRREASGALIQGGRSGVVRTTSAEDSSENIGIKTVERTYPKDCFHALHPPQHHMVGMYG